MGKSSCVFCVSLRVCLGGQSWFPIGVDDGCVLCLEFKGLPTFSSCCCGCCWSPKITTDFSFHGPFA